MSRIALAVFLDLVNVVAGCRQSGGFLFLKNAMNQQAIRKSYDPNRLLDIVMERLGINNDRDLSHKLQLARKVVINIRNGCLPIGASMLLWMSESTGISLNELRHILGDQRRKFRLNCSLNAS
jgi:hypothetical protein